MRSFAICFLVLTVVFSTDLYSSEKDGKNPSLALIPLSGTYFIPGDFATINDAALSLNLNGISGPVLFNVAANHTETAPAGTSAAIPGGIIFGNIAGTTAVNTITFQKNGVGANPHITAGLNHFAGGIMDAIVKIVGTDYLIFDSIDLSENPLNTASTIASNNMTEFGVAFFYATTTNGAQNNTFSNCTITLNTGGTNYPNTFGVFSTAATNSINGTSAASINNISGSHSNNKLYGNTIIDANFGIAIVGSNTAAAMDAGWDIGGTSALTGNTITNFGIGNGTTASAYLKLGTTVQGIFVNQIANHNISYNTISSTNGTATTTIFMSGIYSGWSGTMVQPLTNTSSYTYNTITVTNGLSETTGGIWSRIGNATSNKTVSHNTITLINTSTTAVASKFTRGIYQATTLGELITSNNTITIHYENSDHTHEVAFIQADIPITINREIHDNILRTPVGETLRTSGNVYGISHNGTTSGTLSIKRNSLSIDKGNVNSALVFSGISSSNANSTATVYEITDNIISLQNSSTTNGATIISGIYNNDGTATTNKTIATNTISLTGTNIGGISYGVYMGRTGVLDVEQNTITIATLSPNSYGVYLFTGCTTNNVNTNQVGLSPIGLKSTSILIGISNTFGTLTASNNTVLINPTVAPIATTSVTCFGVANAIANSTVSSSNITLTPSSTEPSIVVNFTSTGISNSGTFTSVSNSNTIQITASTLTGAANSNGINNSGANSEVSNNAIQIGVNSATATTVQGITNSSDTVSIQNNNAINIALTCIGNGSINGINNSGALTTILANQNLTATLTSTSGTSRLYGINNTALSTVISNHQNMNLNAVSQNSSTSLRGISSDENGTISNNTNCVVTATAGTTSAVFGIFGTGLISNNTLTATSNAQTGITSSAGIQSSSNSSVLNNNCLTNFYTASGDVFACGINSTNQNSLIANNTIDHTAISAGNQASLLWIATICGIRSYGIDTTIENNTISKVYGSMGRGTTLFEIAGIILDTAENALVNNNVISNVSSNGTIDNRTYLSGIYALTGTYNATIKNNRIFDISFNNNLTGLHPGPGFSTGQPVPANTNGIWVRLSFNTVVNTYKIYNNHISKLYNPSASSLGGIFGMALSSREVNHLVYNNTVLIGDNSNSITSNITGNFGGAAVGFVNRVGTGITDLRNNILYVNVIPKSSGYVSALAAIKNHDVDLGTAFTNPGQTGVRPVNYHPSSNNNLFYAPSVHNRRSYFYCEGNGFGTEYNRFNIDHNTVAIHDPNINVSPFVGCTSKYKTLMNGGASNYGSDSNSYYDNVTLTEGVGLEAGYWTPSGETYAELGAQVLAAEYDLDSKNVSRGSTPDMGALQFSGTQPTAPTITYGPITVPGSCGAVVSTLDLENVHIVDTAGIPISGSLMPRLYYRINAGAYVSVAGTLISGDGNDGYWNFTMTGLTAGTIDYFVIAQDQLTKIDSNPSPGLVACNVNSVTTPPTTPSSLVLGGSAAIYSLGAWSSPPTLSKAVIFDDDFSSTVSIEACSVLVKSGRTVVFNSAHTLYVQNEVTVEVGGNLIFENNSKLVQIENVANSGDIQYKRISNLKKMDYVYWSSPVNGFNLDNLNTLLPTGPKYKWETTTPNSNGGIGTWINAQGNTMETARGYITRAPNSFNTASTTPFLSTFIGVPNNGDISRTISRGPITTTTIGSYTSANGVAFTVFDDNLNLIGNPYPSAISANHLLFENRESNGGDLAGFIQVWRHGIDLQTGINNPFYGSFVYNYDMNDYLTYNIIGASCCPSVGDYSIGAGQGFFVQMIEGDAASGTVNFTNLMRRDLSNVPYDNSTFYRTSNSNFTIPEKHRIWLDLVDRNNRSERTLIGYIDGATNDFDSFYDVPSLQKNALDLYSLIGNQHHEIEGRTLPFDEFDEVPLGYYTLESGNHHFALAAIDGLFENQSIYIKDAELNVIHDLKLSPYEFHSEIGHHNQRFSLVYKNNSLNVPENEFENSILVVSNETKIEIKSTHLALKEVRVFDISGRLLYHKEDIETKELSIIELTQNNRVLLIEITTEDNQKTIKKIII